MDKSELKDLFDGEKVLLIAEYVDGEIIETDLAIEQLYQAFKDRLLSEMKGE